MRRVRTTQMLRNKIRWMCGVRRMNRKLSDHGQSFPSGCEERSEPNGIGVGWWASESERNVIEDRIFDITMAFRNLCIQTECNVWMESHITSSYQYIDTLSYALVQVKAKLLLCWEHFDFYFNRFHSWSAFYRPTPFASYYPSQPSQR